VAEKRKELSEEQVEQLDADMGGRWLNQISELYETTDEKNRRCRYSLWISSARVRLRQRQKRGGSTGGDRGSCASGSASGRGDCSRAGCDTCPAAEAKAAEPVAVANRWWQRPSRPQRSQRRPRLPQRQWQGARAGGAA